MTEQELLALGQDQDWREILQHPDPDPDTLPAVIPSELLTQEQTVAHVLRATLRLDAELERQTERMKSDLAAWQAEIARLQAKRDNWRAMVRDWMERTGTTQIKTPWFTASIGKGRTKIVVDDETAAIDRCKRMGEDKAVRVKESLVKSEFDAVWNARPNMFDDCTHEETGESTLIVRKK